MISRRISSENSLFFNPKFESIRQVVLEKFSGKENPCPIIIDFLFMIFIHYFVRRYTEKARRAVEKKEQFRQVKALVPKDDGRLRAYGWSLPIKNAEQPHILPPAADASQVPVPVIVFCRPLLENEPGMKVQYYEKICLKQLTWAKFSLILPRIIFSWYQMLFSFD